ncbi:MAG: hypothetical protein ABIP03_15570 [Aquihabitans sp.]
MTDKPPRLEIDWLKTVAGALAAVSSAVLLSTLGAAGTIIGAAIGSVALTTGSALYSQGLARSRYRLAHAQSTALRKVGIAQADVRRAGRTSDDTAASHLAHADERLGEAQDDLEAVADEPATLSWGERLTLLPWKRIGLYAAGLFVIAILAITAFELVAGRTVSSYTGGDNSRGTTVTRVGGGGSDQPSKEPTTNPSESTTSADPSVGPSATPSGTSEASPSPSPDLSASPTAVPTDPGTPTATVPTPTATP